MGKKNLPSWFFSSGETFFKNQNPRKKPKGLMLLGKGWSKVGLWGFFRRCPKCPISFCPQFPHKGFFSTRLQNSRGRKKKKLARSYFWPFLGGPMGRKTGSLYRPFWGPPLKLRGVPRYLSGAGTLFIKVLWGPKKKYSLSFLTFRDPNSPPFLFFPGKTRIFLK